MSLLSGIKFIPREARGIVNEDEKKIKRHKSSKHHKHGKHKHDNIDKDRKKSNKDHNQSDSDESDFDMNAIVAAEMEYEMKTANTKRMSWMNHKAIDEEREFAANNFEELIENKTTSKKSNNFDILMAQLTNETEKPFLENKFEPNEIVISKSNSQPTVDDKPQSHIILSNQSMAELLRNKLKSTKGAVILTDTSNIESQSKALTNHMINSIHINNSSSLKSLVQAERYGGEDMDETYKNNILRLGERYEGNEMGSGGVFGSNSRAGMDEEEEINMKMFQNNQSNEEKNEKQLQSIINEQNKLNDITKRCKLCSLNKYSQESNNYTIATGQYTLLRLKYGNYRLHPLHCEIVPIQHIQSVRYCEEDVVIEIKRFKSCIARMFDEIKHIPLFCEVAMNYSKYPHAIIDCIPVPQNTEKEVVMYFKEALASCDDEFTSQHKKLIELTIERPLHRAIPLKFEYLTIEWMTNNLTDKSATSTVNGIVHIIENSLNINGYFLLDVICGILEEDPIKIKFKLKLNEMKEKQDIINFQKTWKNYNWTEYINLI